jgi:hypothetical protein
MIIANDLQFILDSKEVREFIKAADRLSELLSNETIEINELIQKARILMAELYYRSRFLPKIDPKYSTTEDYHPVILRWRYSDAIIKLNEKVYYYSIEPYCYLTSDISFSAMKKSISDDLLCIYFDINACLGLMSEETNKSIEQGLSALENKFAGYLGIICLEVMRVLEYLRFEDLSEEKTYGKNTDHKLIHSLRSELKHKTTVQSHVSDLNDLFKQWKEQKEDFTYIERMKMIIAYIKELGYEIISPSLEFLTPECQFLSANGIKDFEKIMEIRDRKIVACDSHEFERAADLRDLEWKLINRIYFDFTQSNYSQPNMLAEKISDFLLFKDQGNLVIALIKTSN